MSSEFRHFAGLAMIGLLADPEDRDGDREWIVVTPFDKYKVGDVVADGVVANSTTPFGPPKNVRRETCAEAVARLACDQAEALISEIERRTQITSPRIQGSESVPTVTPITPGSG